MFQPHHLPGLQELGSVLTTTSAQRMTLATLQHSSLFSWSILGLPNNVCHDGKATRSQHAYRCLRSVAVDIDDFSNNLASDLELLLSLLGDSMTKQFLSESTTFLDYIIFAVAPIGTITAAVSAVRLCGSTALRAFIGRSQGGQGAVEAELCTSTSRHVCEPFTRGGIERVLGCPSILELVYLSR